VRAMWGAPDEQPDHAARACRAGLSMLRLLPQLSQKWAPTLGEPMNVGVGINTGPAWVGNVGSQRKFKYGPQGNTVSLASRVQGATKYLKVNMLVTGDTQAQLKAGFAWRRLCRVRVVNIAQPVDLYEMVEPDAPGWPARKEQYENALAKFEAKDFQEAASILSRLLADYPADGPSLVLQARLAPILANPAGFDPVWELPGK
jgi:adenylate cyclase